jgi:hypothetical protein
MIRLEEQDLEGNRLKDIAKVTKMSPEAFKERFSYLVKPPPEC